MQHSADPHSTAPDDVHLTLLAVAFPAFAITQQIHGWRMPRWAAVRKNAAHPACTPSSPPTWAN